MIIPRLYNLKDYLEANKVLILYGPRQVGKTTLLQQYLNTTDLKYKLDSGDNIKTQNILSSEDFSKILEYAAGYELIVIDEAQRIPKIGQALKILVDQVPNIKIIVTGSSSFELSGQVGEPLTGRKKTLTLYPLAQCELQNIHNIHELKENLEQYLIFGSYPSVLTATGRTKKINNIEELFNSYLLKDILELEKIKSSKILVDLLRLIAFQVGSEISLTELGSNLNINNKTVARYLDLLEKSFVLFNIRGFSRNLRNEINKKSKYYFYDNGIRNAIISNFNEINNRDDVGKLWENFLISERIKTQKYHNIFSNNYFWRTWDQKEIDWIEERDGKLFGFEFKFKKDKFKIPQEFLEAYKNSQVQLVNQDNYLDFLIPKNNN